MIELSFKEVTEAVQGQFVSRNQQKNIRGVSVDSRCLSAGQLFVCLVALRDGHDFIEDAFSRGAALVLIDQKHASLLEAYPEQDFIVVSDTLKALGDLAAYWRSLFDVPVIAITGSNGKTTTKEMCRLTLQNHFQVLATEGNYNNLIGLPLTLFQFDPQQHDLILLEMGMSELGEIARLAEIAAPNYAAITNVGPAHLETLKSIENVALAKSELFSALSESDWAIVNADDPYIPQMQSVAKKWIFGFAENSDCQVDACEWKDGKQKITLSINNQKHNLVLNLPGKYQVLNALIVISLAQLLELPMKEVLASLENFVGLPGRMQSHSLASGALLIDDAYNANPESMLKSLQSLKEIAGSKKTLAILGDMFELGDNSVQLHQKLGVEFFEIGIDYLICVGEKAAHIAEAARAQGMPAEHILCFVEEIEEISLIEKFLSQSQVYLIKASRGMHLDSLVKRLVN